MVGFAGFQFDTEDGDRVIPGFLDAIIGVQGGETKSFPLTFPDSWKQEDLRGLPCQFTVSPLLLQILLIIYTNINFLANVSIG